MHYPKQHIRQEYTELFDIATRLPTFIRGMFDSNLDYDTEYPG